MPRKWGRKENGEADLSGPQTTLPHQVRVHTTSPPATLAPKSVKPVKEYLKDWGIWRQPPSEEGYIKLVEQELTAQELHVKWSTAMAKEDERLREAHKQVYSIQ